MDMSKIIRVAIRIVFTAAGWIYVSAGVFAQTGNGRDTAGALTLDQCVDYALKHQPIINQAIIGQAIVKATNAINTSGWLPQAGISGNLTHYLSLPTNFIKNSGTGAVTMEELAATLPTGWAPINGTWQRDSVAIANPFSAGSGVYRLTGPFTVGANSSSTFTFDATAGSAGTSGIYSAIGTLAGGQIDSTTSVNDNVPDTETLNVLGAPDAVDDSADDSGWANLGAVGNIIRNKKPDFDSRNYGYKKLSELLDASSYFEAKLVNGVAMVRREKS